MDRRTIFCWIKSPIAKVMGLIFLYLFPSTLLSQNTYSTQLRAYIDQGMKYADKDNNYEAAIDIFQKAIELETSQKKPSDSILSSIYYVLYHAYGYNDQYDQGLIYAQKVLPYLVKKYGYDNKHTIDTYYDIGYIYSQLDISDTAEIYFQGAIEYYRNFSGDSTHDLALTYHNYGTVLGVLRKYHQQLEVLEKALAIWKCIYGDENSFTISSYQAIGVAYGRQGIPLKGVEYLQKALTLSEKKGIATYAKYAELATAYNGIEFGHEKSIFYYKKSLEILDQEQGRLLDKSTILSLIGEKHSALGDHDTALDYLKQSLEIYKNSESNSLSTLMDRYIKTGRIYRFKNEHQKARAWIKRGLVLARQVNYSLYCVFALDQLSLSMQATQEFDSALIYRQYGMAILENNDLSLQDQNPRKKVNHEKILPTSNFFSYLISRSTLFIATYQANPKAIEDLDWAEQGFEAALSLGQEIESRGANNISFNKSMARLTEGYLELMMIRYRNDGDQKHLNKAFSIAERAKARKLLFNIQQNKARKFVGIPDSVQLKESQMKSLLTSLHQRVYQERRKGNRLDSAIIRSLQNQAFDLSREFEQYLEFLDQEYPDYHNLKYQTEIADIKNVQKNLLNKQTALIEYFWGDSNLYIFTIHKNAIHLNQLSITENLSEQIVDFRRMISQPLSTNPSNPYKDFSQASYKIYQELLAKSAAHLKSNIQKIIIIPDKQISYIPFEVLLTESLETTPLTFQKAPYLIQKFDINYAYSATVLSQQLEPRDQKAQKLLAVFAPDYNGYAVAESDTLGNEAMAMLVRDGQLPLPGAKKEAELISSLLGGSIFTEDNATENQFKQIAGDYRILHLAMHTLIEEDDPLYSRLLFSQSKDSLEDDFLYAAELYNLNLRSDLAVLSACNTGYGRLSRNDGLLSISRAFAYAGCPSIVMSLWKVPDKETSQIMVDFYTHLKSEMNKDEALRQAKLNYLSQLKVEEMAHPFYWAGFIAMGNHTALDLGNANGWKYLLGVLIIALLIGAGMWRRKRSVS